MTISVEKLNDILVLNPEGRIDSTNAEKFKNEVTNYINEQDTSIILDFNKVEYISSACLRSLLSISKHMSQNKRDLVLCGLSESVNKIIKVSGFDSVLKIYETRDDALKSL